MAHVLHDGHHHDDCMDCSGSNGHSGDCSGSESDRRDKRRRRRRRERLIPVGTISIDCSPVSFHTPGQARNLVTCPVTTTMNSTVTETVVVQTPTDFGCIMCTPMTQTMEVPVMTTVNMAPTLVPVPRTVCPENVLCAQICPTPVMAAAKPCGCRG